MESQNGEAGTGKLLSIKMIRYSIPQTGLSQGRRHNGNAIEKQTTVMKVSEDYSFLNPGVKLIQNLIQVPDNEHAVSDQLAANQKSNRFTGVCVSMSMY